MVCLSPHGRRNGEALACLSDKLLTELAIARHKHHMGKRYIEVRVVYIIQYRFYFHTGQVYNELTEEFLDHTGGQYCVEWYVVGLMLHSLFFSFFRCINGIARYCPHAGVTIQSY